MPKKRHHVKYSKPQSTAPASLSSSNSVLSGRGNGNDNDSQGRSVNELIADLRRVGLRPHQVAASHSVAGAPTVPPAIRRILQLPETPPPAPRRPVRFGPDGRRLPPGPPAPRSWLSSPPHGGSPQQHGASESGRVAGDLWRHGLPGAYIPARGSLTDMALRKFAADWEFQRSYNRYYLYELPSHLRAALVMYLGVWYSGGVSVDDLRAILLPAPEVQAEMGDSLPNPSSANENLSHLDLTGAPGRSLKLRDLSDLLFPSTPNVGATDPAATSDLQESWDVAVDDLASAVPRPLLPNLTHLSLAVAPGSAPSSVSWRNLLLLASRLPTLSHLSIAHWPEPSLTPNARLATAMVVSGPAAAAVPYSGTGPYSHSLDGDWSEAVALLRRLSRNLYGLESLDLTGCGSWFPALTAAAVADHQDNTVSVDWVGAWGKVERLVLHPGYRLEEEAAPSERARYVEAVDVARMVERHIRARREGRGRRITVETAERPGGTG